MSAFYKFLSNEADGTAISLLLLALRLFLRWITIISWDAEVGQISRVCPPHFPDPLGVGHSISLGLRFFGSFFVRLVLYSVPFIGLR